MRDRLIELLRQIEFDYSEECVCAFEDGYKGAPDFAKFFVDHLLVNRVIVLPCKIGDTIYFVSRGEIIPMVVNCISFSSASSLIRSRVIREMLAHDLLSSTNGQDKQSDESV